MSLILTMLTKIPNWLKNSRLSESTMSTPVTICFFLLQNEVQRKTLIACLYDRITRLRLDNYTFHAGLHRDLHSGASPVHVQAAAAMNGRMIRLSKCRFATSCEAFLEDYAKHHVSLSSLQRVLLTMGSAAISLTNPSRGDMIACLGETTGKNALVHCHQQMRNTSEGQRILAQKPRINTSTVDLSYLKDLPPGTVGRMYRDFLDDNNVSPDDRSAVQFVDDIELAYVMQRYREVHDIFHAILLMPTTMLGEVSVKWVEALQMHFPMCITGAIFGASRLRPRQRQLYLDHYLSWSVNTGLNAKFLLGIYYEERWEQSLEDFHREMNIVRLI